MSENRDNYTRVYEIIQLINRLATTTVGLTHENIEEMFGWKKRTRERVLQMIASMYPSVWAREIRDDGKARFRLLRQSVVPVNYIDEQDFAALGIAIEAARGNDLIFVIWEGKIKPLAPKELIDEYRRLLNAARYALE